MIDKPYKIAETPYDPNMLIEISKLICNGVQLGCSNIISYALTEDMLSDLFELDSRTVEDLEKEYKENDDKAIK